MLKGKMYYNNKIIKYKVTMRQDENDIIVVIKTRLGKHSLFPLELILDKFVFTTIPFKEDIDKSNIKKNEFLQKWNILSSLEIKNIVGEFIKYQIDEDESMNDKDWKTDKLVDDFNYKGCYYENSIPDIPRKILMPECKEPKTTNVLYNYKKSNKENNINAIEIKNSIEVYLSEALLRLSECKLNSIQANSIAREYIDKLNLHNTVSVHKAINWYAKEILNRIETDKNKVI